MEELSQRANSKVGAKLTWHLSKSLRLEIFGTEKLSILRALLLDCSF